MRPNHPRTDIPTLDQVREMFAPVLECADAKKAVVFGSYALGEADRHSDLNLIIAF